MANGQDVSPMTESKPLLAQSQFIKVPGSRSRSENCEIRYGRIWNCKVSRFVLEDNKCEELIQKWAFLNAPQSNEDHVD